MVRKGKGKARSSEERSLLSPKLVRVVVEDTELKKRGWRSRLFGKSTTNDVTEKNEGHHHHREREAAPTKMTHTANNRRENSRRNLPNNGLPRSVLKSSSSSATSVTTTRGQNTIPNGQYYSSENSLNKTQGLSEQISPKNERRQYRTPIQTRVYEILSRPMGREVVRPEDQRWVVQIAPAEWEDSMWKYRISVQKREKSGEEEILQELTNGMTIRSLRDFYWLEQALVAEFHGSQLIPSLSIALGVPDLEDCQHEVDTQTLTYWLSDVLNGIRGCGEWSLSHARSMDWTSSESMEAFLFSADAHQSFDTLPNPSLGLTTIKREKNETIQWEDGGSHGGSILKWIAYGDVCGGFTSACAPGYNLETTKSGPPVLSPPKEKKFNLAPLNRQAVASGSLGNARSLHVADSFVDHSNSILGGNENTPAKFASLIESERELIWNWRMRALVVMEKIRILQNKEQSIAQAWKKFAISISNLFAFEKGIESARLSDKSRKDLQMPYRKLQKSTVDEILRILAKQKIERSASSLEQLSTALSVYVADLSCVSPAVDAYGYSLGQLGDHVEYIQRLQAKKIIRNEHPSKLKDQIQAGLNQVKKQLATSGDEGVVNHLELQQARIQLETVEKGIEDAGNVLQANLVRFCQIVPVRTSRIAYAYFQTESRQASAMHALGMNTRARINVTSKTVLSKMIHRHGIEMKEDQATEVQLVQRIINLGNMKRFTKLNDGTEEVERGVEINTDFENRRGELRDRAMELFRVRLSRWDSKVAMAIMKAVGVEDANVRVEETTRDLRLVRKHAIGLREQVERCAEALRELKSSVQGNGNGIQSHRHDMIMAIQSLFSGSYKPMEHPDLLVDMERLLEEGIPCNDPLGWSETERKCGGCLNAYVESRDSQIDWLLKCFDELLKDYIQRVESIESFVYMECVGIQLEKHFSQQRAMSLAAFEKKTDITSAINIATRKRMTALIGELHAKLAALGADVSHTTVKEAKESHLESKALKQELHELSMRQLARARETATERAIAMMTLWAKEEEASSSRELARLAEALQVLESSIDQQMMSWYTAAIP